MRSPLRHAVSYPEFSTAVSSNCSKVYSRFSASTSSFLERRGGRPSAFRSFALRSALPGLPESPPLVEVGIGDLPSLRTGCCGTRLCAKGIPQRLQNDGVVHTLDPQQALLAGLFLALFLAVDRGHVSLYHILFSHQIGDVGADAEACRVRIRQQDQAVFFCASALNSCWRFLSL